MAAATLPPDEDMPFVFVDQGPVPDQVRSAAEEMVARLRQKSPRPVIFARVKVIVDPDRHPDEEAIAQGTLDVSGSIIRAQVAAPSPRDALNVLHDRLERRLRRLSERRQTAQERPPQTEDGEWRRGDLPSVRPGYFPRPVDDREVVRRKTFSPGEEISVEEALFDLEVLDHRFFLFADAADGEVSLVYEDEGRVKLQKLSGTTRRPQDVSLGVEPNPTPAPEMSVEEAEQLLDAGSVPFVFFRDAGSGEGCVMYRRYDGHYGLVAPQA